MNIPTSTLANVFSGFHTSLIGRAIVPACALLGSLALAPTASAKAPDGTYAFTSGSGKVTLAGRTFPLSKKRLKEIASAKNGSVVIKDGKITLDRDAALNIISDAAKEMDFSIDDLNPTITLTGPSSLKFSKAGKSYVAATANPVVMKLSADVSGTELAGVVRSNFDAKVTGGKLVIHVKFGGKLGFVGSIDQQEIQGSAEIVCAR